MAWRLHDLVVEGELDNTTRGIVRGWIRFSDRTDVIRLFLLGDCHPDLAGGRFKIKRLREVPPWAEPADSTPLAAEQSGHVGDITADQTIRDSDCPVEELLARIRAGEPPPHVMRKALYLEWYSNRHGRVVIQDTRLGVEQIGQRAFELTAEDLRRKQGQDERALAQAAEEGYHVELVTFAFPSYWPTDEEIEEQFGSEVLAICLDSQRGPVEKALQGREVGLFPGADPFPKPEIQDYDPDLPPSQPRRRKIREMFDPPLAAPAASRLSKQRARAELRKMQVLLLPLNIRLEICSHFDPRLALEWAECSVLWADIPAALLAEQDQVPSVLFRSADSCDRCREELGPDWRAPY